VILVPDFVNLSQRELQALTAYVDNGGTLIVFRGKTLFGPTGDPNVRTMISSLLGIDYLGQTPDTAAYLAPTQAGKPLFPDHSPDYPLAVYGSHARVAVTGNARTLATIVLPYQDPFDPARFSSAISTPPWQPTDLPAIVEHPFGKGTTLFISGTLEQGKYPVQRDAVIRLINRLAGPLTLETDAPKAVELTVLHHAEKNRYAVNLVNCQETLPAVPVPPVTVRLKVCPADRVAGQITETVTVTVKRIPEGSIVPHTIEGGIIQFKTDILDTFLMYWVELT
jgi:hypothetical protein